MESAKIIDLDLLHDDLVSYVASGYAPDRLAMRINCVLYLIK